MARGRMVNTKISASERVNSLPGEAPLLYTWLISWLDCNGRYSGNPNIIKGKVFTLRKATPRQIESWLKVMEGSKNHEGRPLLFRYEVNGQTILEMPGFAGEQVGLRANKEHAEYPPPDPKLCRKMCGKNPADCPQYYAGKQTEEIRTEDGKNPEKGRKESDSPARAVEVEGEGEGEFPSGEVEQEGEVESQSSIDDFPEDATTDDDSEIVKVFRKRSKRPFSQEDRDVLLKLVELFTEKEVRGEINKIDKLKKGDFNVNYLAKRFEGRSLPEPPDDEGDIQVIAYQCDECGWEKLWRGELAQPYIDSGEKVITAHCIKCQKETGFTLMAEELEEVFS